MKKETKPEARFALHLIVRASLLGEILAFIDNRADEQGVQLVKTIDEGKNFPRGALATAITEMLEDGPMPMKELKAKLREAKFANTSVHGAVGRLLKLKQIKETSKGRVRFLHLVKGK